MRLRPLTAALSIGALFALAIVREARADEPSAEALFQDAMQLVAKGDYAAACPKFAQSHRLEPAVGTQFNLADCYEHTGKTASAWTTFRDVAAIARAAGKFERERIATQRAAAIEPRVGRLRLKPQAPAPGLELRLDGHEIARDKWSAGLPIDAGEHELVASAPGRTTWKSTTTTRDGGVVDWAIPELVDPQPKAAPLAVAPVPGPAPKPSSSQRTIALVVGGAGIVAAGVGTIAGAMSLSSRSDGERDCPKDVYQFRCPTQEGADSWRSATTAGDVSTIAFVVAGVVLAGAAVLWFTAPSPRSARSTHASHAPMLLGGRF